MKVLLVMPNMLIQAKEYIPAYGIMYVSSFLKRKGFDIHTLNMNHCQRERLDDTLRHDKFDAVCTGGLFTHLTEFREILRRVKEHNKNSKTILGGPVATAHPEFAMGALRPDYLVIGEGEQTAADLLAAIDGNGRVSDVPGIAFHERGQFQQTDPSVPIDDLDSLPFPDYDGFEYGHFLDKRYAPRRRNDISFYNENLRTGYVVGGRDCPGKCTFCFRITGGKFRLRSVDSVISEIQYLVNRYDINDVELMDDLFSLKKSRIYEFCHKIKPLRIPWYCQLRVPGVDEELLAAMKAAGCYLVSYGFESASDTVLKSMQKGIRAKQIERVLPMTRKAKMTIQANFIFGDPAETLETAEETLKFARRYKQYQINLGFVKPFPGSTLYGNLVAHGAIKNLEYFWIHSTIDEGGRMMNMTTLDHAEFTLLRARVLVERNNRIYHKVNSVKVGNDGTYSISLICPYCKMNSTDISLKEAVVIACRHCFMRAYIDPIDLSYRGFFARKARKFLRYQILMISGMLLSRKCAGLFLVRGFLLFRKYLQGLQYLKRLHMNV